MKEAAMSPKRRPPAKIRTLSVTMDGALYARVCKYKSDMGYTNTTDFIRDAIVDFMNRESESLFGEAFEQMREELG